MIQESIVIGKETKYPLKGILCLPGTSPNRVMDDVQDGFRSSEQKYPAVVFVHGSGSSNRDEKVMKMTPFKDLAEGLAAKGIASVRYDKRSYAHGLKIVLSKTPVTVKEETIEDAILAADLLRQDERIDSDRIFIVGHSMGGMLAPRIDAEGGNFRGLVLMAGTPRNLDQILVEQLQETMEEMPALVRRLSAGKIQKMIRQMDGLYELTDEEAKATKLGNGVTFYYFKEMGEHGVETYLRKTQKPILVMQGSKDAQVKVDKDFEAYREILKDHPDVTFRLYEGLNHCFVPALYDSLSKMKQEYGVERHIGEEVIGDLAEWILKK